jgi:hypothetical protein
MSDKTARVCKASSLRSEQRPNGTILICDDIDKSCHPPQGITVGSWESEYRAFYRRQANEIAEVLFATLPGGTIDQLLCAMLERRTSLFQVPLFSEETT